MPNVELPRDLPGDVRRSEELVEDDDMDTGEEADDRCDHSSPVHGDAPWTLQGAILWRTYLLVWSRSPAACNKRLCGVVDKILYSSVDNESNQPGAVISDSQTTSWLHRRLPLLSLACCMSIP